MIEVMLLMELKLSLPIGITTKPFISLKAALASVKINPLTCKIRQH